MGKSKGKLLRKQAMMRQVLLALTAPLAGAIYFFGWRALAMVAVCCAVGLVAEWLWCRKRGEPVSEAVFVTAVIYALIMPPTVGWHVLAIGMLFAVMVVKEVFGGFGRNVFNPAMAARCFVYVCFPVWLTATWAPVAEGPMGALGQWDTVTEVDAVTSATPLAEMKLAAEEGEEVELPRLWDLFFGRIAGTMGATSTLLTLIGGGYLFVKKVASRHIILSVIITYGVLNEILFLAGVTGFYGAQYTLMGGGFLFGAFFIATDPVSGPKTKVGQVLYGILIGVATTVIRNWSIFNGGLMFSILLGNMFAPSLDMAVRGWQGWRKGRAMAAAKGGAA